MSNRPEWLEHESLEESLADARDRHRRGFFLSRHRAELFWHCDQVLAELAALRAELGRIRAERDAALATVERIKLKHPEEWPDRLVPPKQAVERDRCESCGAAADEAHGKYCPEGDDA